MNINKTNEKGITAIVIAISVVSVIIIITTIFLIIHIRKSAVVPNNNIITNRVVKDNTVSRNTIKEKNNIISNNTVKINNNTIENNTITTNNVVMNNNIIVNNNIETNTTVEENNTVVNNNIEPEVNEVQNNEIQQPNNETITPIKLNIKGKENLESGGEFLYINDYKISIPKELTQIGYEVVQRDDVLGIRAKDSSYQCILMQLSDNYVMPTEEEINRFYETEEYKAWDKEKYDYDDEAAEEAHYDKYNKISTDYYKSLGYTVKNCPNYTLTNEEEQKLIGKYILEGEQKSSATSGLFPGYMTFTSYDWGATKFYTIPKYYNDSQFGENTSNLSICLYFFEYYDREKVKFNVDLWRY